MASMKTLFVFVCLFFYVAAHSMAIRQTRDDTQVQQVEEPNQQNSGLLKSLPSVAYFAVDVSTSLDSTTLDFIKAATRVLVLTLATARQFAVSSFSGDDSGPGSYLQEAIPPSFIASSRDDILKAIADLDGSSRTSRNVGAAIRDAIAKLKDRKDEGGSVLYLISAPGTTGTELELEIVDALIKNNIHVVIVEIGADGSLGRFSLLAGGIYFSPTSISNAADFHDINLAVSTLLEEPLATLRHVLISENATIESDSFWQGTFQMPSDVGTDTVAALHYPTEGSFKADIKDPSGSIQQLDTQDGNVNWNDSSATVGLATIGLSNMTGDWQFSVYYFTEDCTSCPDTISVIFQVTSSTRSDENPDPSWTTVSTSSTTISTSSTTVSTSSTTISTSSTTVSTSSPSTSATTATTSHSPTMNSSTVLMTCGLSLYLWIGRYVNVLKR